MVAQHNLPVNVRDGDAVKTVVAGPTVFRIGDDGKLAFARSYDVDVGDRTLFWRGMVPLSGATMNRVDRRRRSVAIATSIPNERTP